MRFPIEPLWTFATDSVASGPNRYFISTVNTSDMGLETMVFPATKEAHIHDGLFESWVEGVDFEKPLEQFTRHYENVADAKAGHKEIVKIVQEMKRVNHDHTQG